MHINYITNADLCNITRANIWKVPHNIDGIICIPRGGLLVGSILAEFLHKPVYTVDSFLAGRTLGNGTGLRDASPWNPTGTYIIVDDSVSSGASFTKALQTLGTYKATFICVAVIGEEGKIPANTDVVMHYVPEPRIFELNFYRQWFLHKCILDIDGVLCVDPEPGCDLDEERYINHILNAPPMIPLQEPILALCTHRPQRYAPQTQRWLQQNGIQYGMLHMLGVDSIPEKIQKMNTPEFINMKTTIYDMYKDANLFIESNWDEANRIYRSLRRPVLCTDANIMLQD